MEPGAGAQGCAGAKPHRVQGQSRLNSEMGHIAQMGLRLSIVAEDGIKPLVLLSPPSAGVACMRLHIRCPLDSCGGKLCQW